MDDKNWNSKEVKEFFTELRRSRDFWRGYAIVMLVISMVQSTALIIL